MAYFRVDSLLNFDSSYNFSPSWGFYLTIICSVMNTKLLLVLTDSLRVARRSFENRQNLNIRLTVIRIVDVMDVVPSIMPHDRQHGAVVQRSNVERQARCIQDVVTERRPIH